MGIEFIQVVTHPWAIGLALLALVLFVVWLYTLATPSANAVILRNALLASVGDKQDFQWSPDQTPRDYLAEQQPAPQRMLATAQRLRRENGDDWQTAIALASHLLAHPQTRGGAIMADAETAYQAIVRGSSGYCADFTQAYVGLAHAANLPVREWGMAFDRFGAGHGFNEVYDKQRRKWIFIDPYKGFYVMDRSRREPMSVLEFRAYLLAHRDDEIEIGCVVDEDKLDFPNLDALFTYYHRGEQQFYMWWGNAVFSYDRHPFTRLLAKVSRSAEQLGAIIIGIHPRIKIPLSDGSAVALAGLRARRRALILCTTGAVLASTLLLIQLGLTLTR